MAGAERRSRCRRLPPAGRRTPAASAPAIGIVVTKGGLVFHAGNDGKLRAYDEDTGKVLWTGTFAGSAPAFRCRTKRRAASSS